MVEDVQQTPRSQIEDVEGTLRPSVEEKPRYDPDAAPLTDSELKAAVESNVIRTFPKVVRHIVDPPIPNQEYTNVSFVLLREPKNGVYGFLKVRGTWPNDEAATKDAKRIIKEVDSTNVIHLVPHGHAVPITNDERYSKDQLDVKMREDEIALRDEAQKESLSKQRQQQRELDERRRDITEKDDMDDPNSLNYYTKRRVTQLELKKYIVQSNEKIKGMKKSLKKIENEIASLNKNHPEYLDDWLENYNRARGSVGLKKITEQELANIEIVGPVDEKIYE